MSVVLDRKLRKTEQQLRGEVGDLRGQLDASRLENSRVATELATKESQIQHLEVSEIRKHKTEITKVRIFAQGTVDLWFYIMPIDRYARTYIYML